MMKLMKPRRAYLYSIFFLTLPAFAADAGLWERPYLKWTLEEAVEILNQSPWARQETFTRIIGGIGSGLHGEKEIYSTFFVRLLSARPVRQAYARVRQIQAGYDQMDKAAKRKYDDSHTSALKMDVSNWIVVAVSFRSNDPGLELQITQFLQVQTTETMRAKAFLSTPRFHQVKLSAYFPPQDEVVGAKFVFPRRIQGVPVVVPEDQVVSFELDVPSLERDLRANFFVTKMMVKGEPVL
jgi:hypothetical protein